MEYDEYADTTTGYGYADNHQFGVCHFDREPHHLQSKHLYTYTVYPYGVKTLIGMRNPVTVLCLAIKGSPIGITCHQKMNDTAKKWEKDGKGVNS